MTGSKRPGIQTIISIIKIQAHTHDDDDGGFELGGDWDWEWEWEWDWDGDCRSRGLNCWLAGVKRQTGLAWTI